MEGFELPDPPPFSGIEFEARPSTLYFGTFQLEDLIGRAREELATQYPEQFKILLLCGMCGLRRREVDLLEWSSLRFDESAIRIQTTAHFSAKTRESAADVKVDPELLALLKGYQERSTGPFIIEAPGCAPKNVVYAYYRAQEHFEGLINWLRRQGLRSPKPLHELRKAFGSLINEKAGIHAASRALRHSNIGITAAVYVDSRSRVAAGLGHLLSDKIVEFKQEVA
jgi:integrase